MLYNVVVLKEKIQDKLHGIPIDVSVEIKNSKRKRRQSSSPLTPVLDANEPTRALVTECVNLCRPTFCGGCVVSFIPCVTFYVCECVRRCIS